MMNVVVKIFLFFMLSDSLEHVLTNKRGKKKGFCWQIAVGLRNLFESECYGEGYAVALYDVVVDVVPTTAIPCFKVVV